MEKSNYPPEGFPKRLYDAWIVSGMTQTEAAGWIGYERKTFCHWIHGDSAPNALALARLCILFGVSADYLLFGKGEKAHGK